MTSLTKGSRQCQHPPSKKTGQLVRQVRAVFIELGEQEGDVTLVDNDSAL